MCYKRAGTFFSPPSKQRNESCERNPQAALLFLSPTDYGNIAEADSQPLRGGQVRRTTSRSLGVDKCSE